MKFIKLLPALLLVCMACTQPENHQEEDSYPERVNDPNLMDSDSLSAPKSDITKAIATLMPLGDQEMSGSVTFEKTEDGVMVSGNFTGLEDGEHGFHIHEYGDCSAADGTSAGGHFNPNNNDHGAPDQDNSHMGDMGNLTATAQNAATIQYVDDKINIDQILGRGVIIHSGADDLESQPSGDAGNRIACGVIGVAQE